MNAAEIEDEVSKLAEAPFDAQAFPYQFLQAFGVNETALAKLRAGRDNKSDVRDEFSAGVLQRAKNNIHLKTCPPGRVVDTLADLRNSEATKKLKAKYVLATDGQTLAAERFRDGETLACNYKDLPNRFGFLLDLAGISTTPKIDENAFDIRATNKLNKLYVELLRHNPDWGTDARRQDLNHFFARLIFCFFAEDTNIFTGGQLFTCTVEQYTDRTGANVHEILAELFRAMDTRREDRAGTEKAPELRPFALKFPYVNGNLFSGSTDTPRFSQAARIYLLTIGSLDWKKINPDIFGSMIQAVADDEERGALGMHYTSVPNILKVLNPLFLDDLRAKLEEAGDSPLKLFNLRKRLARIRVFDPACGSGNFLVIAYKEMRQIEAIINERRGERDLKSAIPISNFRGIELRSFPAEIARLALIIAEFQCDVLYRGQLIAEQEFLPLKRENWIVCGNALRLDWLTVCPPTGTGVKIESDGLFKEKLEQVEIDFENAGGETFICGNPPYKGSQWQTADQKQDLRELFRNRSHSVGSMDYVSGWFIKAADYGKKTTSAAAFVSTNSICQGRHVESLWPMIFGTGHEIVFAYTSFKWENLASHNAGVTVTIVGMSAHWERPRRLFYSNGVDGLTTKEVSNINAYLAAASNVIVEKVSTSRFALGEMTFGNMPNDGGFLLLSTDDAHLAKSNHAVDSAFVRPFLGSQEFIRGIERRCLWVPETSSIRAYENAWLQDRFARVKAQRLQSDRATTKQLAKVPFRFGEVRQSGDEIVIIIPSVSSESRQYLPAGYCAAGTIVSNLAFAMYDAPIWNLSLIVSRLHLIWIATVCGKLKTDYRYSNTLGWNTFPVPTLTDQNKTDLTRCAEDILLAREAYFPATIADMYDPDRMDSEFPDLRAAHGRNDETLERIYIGRRFRNDTERLEKLFAMYTEMTAKTASSKAPKRRKSPK